MQVAQRVRVVTIAESTVVRAGLRALLQDAPDIEVVADARNANEACRVAREAGAEVAVLEVRDPAKIDERTCQEIRQQYPACKVLIITARSDDETILGLIMDGAAGYLFEDVTAEELANAIRTVWEGGAPMDPQMASVVAGRLRARSLGEHSPWAPLTIDEYEVLERIVRGETNRQISKELRLDDKIIKHRVSSILKKIGAKNRVAAAAWWARHQPEPARQA
ncbi:MAG: response regulator transcription factor [Thermaerobacter sp.]|nr:response regulator transcription factor [Thermaerobacter sp.]